MIDVGTNKNVAQRKQPDESPAGLHQVAVCQSVMEASVLIQEWDRFCRDFDADIHVKLKREGHVIYHVGPSMTGQRQFKAFVDSLKRWHFYEQSVEMLSK